MKGSKGQISIEFIMLLLVILILFYAVVIPNLDFASFATQDVSRLSQTKLAAQELANSVETVSASAKGARQTITIFIPAKSEINLNCSTVPKTIVFSSIVDYSKGLDSLTSNNPPGSSKCVSINPSVQGAPLNCTGKIELSLPSLLGCSSKQYKGESGSAFTVRVEKNPRTGVLIVT